MPLTIHSPHSGHPVKIRDEDIGRAVRDEANKIFYVVPRAGGKGYYGAVTRKGSAKDEERYDRLAANPAQVAAANSAAASSAAASSAAASSAATSSAAAAEASARAAHDATGGRKRRRPVRRAVLTLIVLGGLAVGGAVGLDRLGLLPVSVGRWLPAWPAAGAEGPAAAVGEDANPTPSPAPSPTPSPAPRPTPPPAP